MVLSRKLMLLAAVAWACPSLAQTRCSDGTTFDLDLERELMVRGLSVVNDPRAQCMGRPVVWDADDAADCSGLPGRGSPVCSRLVGSVLRAQ